MNRNLCSYISQKSFESLKNLKVLRFLECLSLKNCCRQRKSCNHQFFKRIDAKRRLEVSRLWFYEQILQWFRILQRYSHFWKELNIDKREMRINQSEANWILVRSRYTNFDKNILKVSIALHLVCEYFCPSLCICNDSQKYIQIYRMIHVTFTPEITSFDPNCHDAIEKLYHCRY